MHYFLFYSICVCSMLFSLVGQAMEAERGDGEETGFHHQTLSIPSPSGEDSDQIKRQFREIDLNKLPEDVRKFVGSFRQVTDSFYESVDPSNQSPNSSQKTIESSQKTLLRNVLLGLLQDIEKRVRPYFGLEWSEVYKEWRIDEKFHQEQADRFKELAKAVEVQEAFYRDLRVRYPDVPMSEDLVLQASRRQLFLDLETSMRCPLTCLGNFPKDFEHKTATLGLRWDGWVLKNQGIVFFTVTPFNYPWYQEALKVIHLCRKVVGQNINIDTIGPYHFPGTINTTSTISALLIPNTGSFAQICRWDDLPSSTNGLDDGENL